MYPPLLSLSIRLTFLLLNSHRLSRAAQLWILELAALLRQAGNSKESAPFC